MTSGMTIKLLIWSFNVSENQLCYMQVFKFAENCLFNI
jgi:hypothetical protein